MPNQSDEPKNVETEERKYLKPVAWLGGRDLLANLKYFLLFAAFKGKLDPRDWMTAEVFPAPKTKLEDLSGWQRDYVEDFKKSFREDPKTDEFWFDYFADSGDGMTAGYALAYLCLSDLQAKLPTSGSLSPADLAAGEIRSRLAKGDNPKQIAGDYRGTAPPDWIRTQIAMTSSSQLKIPLPAWFQFRKPARLRMASPRYLAARFFLSAATRLTTWPTLADSV